MSVPADPLLRLCLLGEPCIRSPDGRTVLLERRAAALLALAALQPGVTRLRAAGLLWPDSDDPRRNLRQQLLRFRRLFGRDLLEGSATLALAPGVALESDMAGPLLGTLDYADCEDFAAWLSQRRQAELARRLANVRRRIGEAEAAGNHASALAAAGELLLIDPRDESHHRECMRLHYLDGNPAAGLAAFARLKGMLAEEFGTLPSAASVELAEALRRSGRPPAGVPQLTGAAHAVLPVTLKRPPALVGRAAEWLAARRAWSEGLVVWLEGEAGLGKSRLIAELLAAPDAPGAAAVVLAGAGRPGDAGAPYATLARLLRPMQIALPQDLSPESRAALAHLGPQGTEPAGPALAAGALAAAVTDLLERSGVATLALDDLHFADAATIDLLAALSATAPAPGAGGRRWLFATRPAEVPEAGRALRSALAELQRLAVVTLSPLDADGVAALIGTLGIPGLAEGALAAALVRHTGGNPLFVLETLKQGLADGTLARGQLPSPVGVAALIEARLGRLSEPALTLARVAAIGGVDFSIELAEAAIGVRAVHLAGAWQELQDAQILRDEAFSHDLVAETVARSVPPVVARRVHAQCAQWLAALGVEPARVARHWQAGGDPARAGDAFVAAALRAEQAGRLQDQAELYAQAAQSFAEAGLQAERFDALCGRVRALAHVDFGGAAIDEARAVCALAASDAQRMRAQLALLGMLVERGQAAEAIEVGRDMMTVATRLNDNELAVRTACHMAAAHCRLGRADEALALLRPLQPWVTTQPDHALCMLWHGDWAATLGALGHLREALTAYDVARAAARRADLPDAESRLMLNAAVALRQAGYFDRALALSRAGHAQSAQDTNDATHRAIARLVIARDECETGCYGPALEALEQVLPQFESHGAGFWAQAARMVLANLWLHLGQPARAMPLLAQDDDPAAPPWLRADRHLLRLDLAHALEQRAAGSSLRDTLALALAVQDTQRGPWLRTRALPHRMPAEALAEARAMADELASSERMGVRAALDVHRAAAALALGEADEARASAERLVAAFDEGVAPDGVYRARAWWVASQAFAAAGRTEDAAQALQRGARWISQQALPSVPAAFIDSFMHRNPTNRALLAAAGR